MESELRKLEEISPGFFINVIESLSAGLMITDHELTVLYANKKLEEITGYKREELVGKPSYKMLLPESAWPLMQKRLDERKRGRVEQYEMELLTKDRSRKFVQVTATPLKDRTGKVVGTIGLTRDISERKRLESVNEYLQAQLEEDSHFSRIIGESQPIKKMLEQISIVGATDASVLITGESGTGKELVARQLHASSLRNQQPMIKVNCAAIPPELFESEFFGHLKGSFTGAYKDRMGRFELADKGTLFLDEVGEIPPVLQSKLLRVLQEGQFEPVGSGETRTVNVRVIAATNRNLAGEVAEGRFREDLYFRLNVFPINVPPLRQRLDDIEQLAPYMVSRIARKLGVEQPKITSQDMERLKTHSWPGNIRVFEHVIERAVILAKKGKLDFSGIVGERGLTSGRESEARVPADKTMLTLNDLKELEKGILLEHLEQKNWKIYGPRGAAESLQIKPTTLVSKMKRFGINKPE